VNSLECGPKFEGIGQATMLMAEDRIKVVRDFVLE